MPASMIRRMEGLHLTADLHGCAPGRPVLADPAALRALCLQAVRAAGLQPVGELFHRFPPPGGVTGVVLLAESHLAVHTWPERAAVTLDVYVCNVGADNSARAEALLATLQAAFAPAAAGCQRLLWGRAVPDGVAGQVGSAEPPATAAAVRQAPACAAGSVSPGSASAAARHPPPA
jgi:S-adenosylmethionine decarboxylase